MFKKRAGPWKHPLQARAIYVLLVITFVSRFGLAFRAQPALVTSPYIEDSFYSLNTAFHFARGEGFSADGIHPTNGVQPLNVLFYSACFALAGGDKWLGVTFTFFLNALIDCASMYVLARLLLLLDRSPHSGTWWRSPAFVGALFWSVLYTVMVHTMNGLETGLYSLAILSATFWYARMRRVESQSTQSYIILGTLLGVVVLSRIDGVFLVIAFVALELLRQNQSRLKKAGMLAGVSALLSLPWWWYNVAQFGSLMPISGQSESMTGSIASNVIRALMTLADILSTFFYTPYYQIPASLYPMWVIMIFSFVFMMIKRVDLWKVLKERYDLRPLMPLFYASLGLIVYYVFFFHAPHFLPRYFQPFRILWLTMFAAAVPVVYKSFKASYREYRSIIRFVVLPILAAAIIFNVNRYARNYTLTEYTDFYAVGQWGRSVYPARIGMDQSATTSFLSSNFLNLDGKVNPEALRARQNGQLGDYIVREHLDYLADWKEFASALALEARKSGVTYTLVDSIGKIQIYRREAFTGIIR